MKNYITLTVISLALVFSTSCSKDNNCVSGSGGSVSRDYSTSYFNALSISGEADVYIVKDSVNSLRIEAQENVLNVLNVETKGQTLTIGEDNCFRNARRLKVFISTPSLVGLSSSGSVDISSSNTFTESDFFCQLIGLR